MHSFRPDRGQTVDKAWNDKSRGHGTTYLGRGTACGQGYQKFQFISAFCYSSIFVGSCPPKKGDNLGFNLDTLDGTRIQKYTVSRLLYPWSLVRSFVVYLGL